MDLLADVLELGRVRGALIADVRAHASWGLELPQSTGASFHAVTSGVAWLRVQEQAPTQLMPGDLVLLPGGITHCLSSEPDGRCRPFDRAVKDELMSTEGRLHLPGSGAVTTFVCAAYDYDLDVGQRLMGRLPDVLHLPADPVSGRDIATIVELLAAEVGAPAPGSRTACARLIDLLLIAAVRSWANQQTPGTHRSWLTARHDPTVTRALALLHERPGDPWTLATLAQQLNISRATLARRFADTVGETPVAYLTRWRMDLAARRLTTSTDSVESIASEVGYSSEYAFNRAFSRHRGQPPGRYRRTGRS